MSRPLLLVAGAAVACASPAAAQVRPLVDPPASADAARAGVVVFLLNEGASATPAQGPAEIETVARDGTRLRLVALPAAASSVAAGGFARVRYRLADAAPVALAATPPDAAPPRAPAAAIGESVVTTSRGGSGAFLDRLHPYAPIYGVFGAGDSGAKLQVSFDFRVLGRDDGPRLDVAYTHTMFWAVDRASTPVRAQGYSPEVFVDVPVSPSLLIGGGFREDSNGGGVTNSIDVNRLYLRAHKTFDLGDRWRLALAPMVWGYFGDQGLAPDLDRYWGYTSLGMTLGQRDGWKLAVTGRGNPGTGKGSAEAFLSYPLVRIDDRLPRLYLFSQFFTGYGETLVEYNRNVSHARFGIALTR
ncbi:phospholipase A [Sphingomonas sp. PAMC 26605]|uniref:phospholipase A n=1 Tax=Sphingomonas sp. PAMC 26605 TaxID=1112214 RepID=UPI000A30A35E|nr:phospholipase A [Sphingomonas sp. PAMC 26605]